MSLVRSHLSHGCEVWAPQGPSSDMYRLESIQRRATNCKFILQDHESSYSDRLKKLNLIPLSYWLELKDIVFFFKCKVGVYELDIQQFIKQCPAINQPVQVLVTFYVQTYAEHLILETHTLVEY